MLRDFEDQENLLAEMDEQVDAYRAAGKVEAAVRLVPFIYYVKALLLGWPMLWRIMTIYQHTMKAYKNE